MVPEEPELPVPELLEPLEPLELPELPLVPELPLLLPLELFVSELLGWAPEGSFNELPEDVPDELLVRLMSNVFVELLRLEPAGSLILDRSP